MKGSHALILGTAAVLAAPFAVIAAARRMILWTARGKTFDRAADLPFRSLGLVLGCAPLRVDGQENLFFKHRIEAARALFEAGKVDLLLVSGHDEPGKYDEPAEMKNALIRAGVPASRIVCDGAGVRTFDSVERAKTIFRETVLTVVSQKFHNQRAIFIARSLGIDAIGLNAADVRGPRLMKTALREHFARARAVFDVCAHRARR